VSLNLSLTIALIPKPIPIGIAYSRMLLHDTMLNEDSFRTATSDIPLCDCGKADESVEHFLLHCENYTEARKVMLNTIEDLVSTSKHRHSLRITEDLLLAPTYQDGIRKSDKSLIKEALFDFIPSCDRNILYAIV